MGSWLYHKEVPGGKIFTDKGEYSRALEEGWKKAPWLVNEPEPVKPKEIERMVLKLADDGHSTSVIGIKLRDQYGVPSVKLSTGKSILRILAEHKRDPKLPEDLRNLMKKAVNIGGHLHERWHTYQEQLHHQYQIPAGCIAYGPQDLLPFPG